LAAQAASLPVRGASGLRGARFSSAALSRALLLACFTG